MLSAPPSQAYLHTDPSGLHLRLPLPDRSWSELWQQIALRLQVSHPFSSGPALLTLWAGGWRLETQHLQAIAALAATRQWGLHRVQTNNRQTAIAAVELGYSVEQTPPLAPTSALGGHADTLYLKTTIRSGTAIRHEGPVAIVGDINPGGEVFAGGDILVWGRLRGVAHAGSGGSQTATIMALCLTPTQLRIADRVARVPAEAVPFPTPEVAYLKDETICISSVSEYLRRTL